jgi:AcrR family transcriptional regulator
MTKSILKQLKEDEREVRRNLIINAAKTLYKKGSFHNIGMRDISNEAGISVASLYQYFPSQDDLFVAILNMELASIKIKLGPNKQSLEDIAINILNFLVDNEDIFLMMSHFMIKGEKKPDVLEKFNAVQDMFLKMLDSVLAKTSPEITTRFYSHAFFTALFGNVITFRNYPYTSDTSQRDNLYHIVRITSRAFQDALQNDAYLKLLSEEEQNVQMS